MDIARKLEKIIAIYFNGDNYICDGVELSRDDSRIVAYSLIHVLRQFEWIMEKNK